MQFHDIIDNISFGIEVETCFNIKDSATMHEDIARLEYYNIFSNMLKYVRTGIDEKYQEHYSALFSNDKYFKSTDYTKWNIISDETINCEANKTSQYYYLGEEITLPTNKDFFPLEIVSPKLLYNIGMKIYEDIWNNIIMSKNFYYCTNDSQGLHINLSYPKMNVNKFIYIWNDIVEEHVLRNLPEYRLEQLQIYAVPYKNRPYRYSRHNLYTYALQKHVPVGVRKDDFGNERIEIRVYQSTMNITEIMEWLTFCVYLLAISVYVRNPYEINIDYIREILPKKLHHFIA
jgi:hypothetical protein